MLRVSTAGLPVPGEVGITASGAQEQQGPHQEQQAGPAARRYDGNDTIDHQEWLAAADCHANHKLTTTEIQAAASARS